MGNKSEINNFQFHEKWETSGDSEKPNTGMIEAIRLIYSLSVITNAYRDAEILYLLEIWISDRLCC